jgi:hypothetical protein
LVREASSGRESVSYPSIIWYFLRGSGVSIVLLGSGIDTRSMCVYRAARLTGSALAFVASATGIPGRTGSTATGFSGRIGSTTPGFSDKISSEKFGSPAPGFSTKISFSGTVPNHPDPKIPGWPNVEGTRTKTRKTVAITVFIVDSIIVSCDSDNQAGLLQIVRLRGQSRFGMRRVGYRVLLLRGHCSIKQHRSGLN